MADERVPMTAAEATARLTANGCPPALMEQAQAAGWDFSKLLKYYDILKDHVTDLSLIWNIIKLLMAVCVALIFMLGTTAHGQTFDIKPGFVITKAQVAKAGICQCEPCCPCQSCPGNCAFQATAAQQAAEPVYDWTRDPAWDSVRQAQSARSQPAFAVPILGAVKCSS